ncbi:H-type lectin domain-containing protein [Yoonia sediminilitoris]|uniref:H-type lectin domain-containing protein n=1 Tax=Yoonia sediminilitoris TaxID=1286148 RepID=A0A2T6KN02_9RHOB|nr:H-type lectin domain-containing protein [Yoonia sediminilitoris]PUB17537.1 H-type lectin domain-containing protein [Yoonia sediminilitoris]RCW97832.1 H-type lectin domain-containing protein [Yoonia sediminilitoris]
MRRLNSGTIGIDHGDVVMFSDFEHDGDMWRGEGPRQSRENVTFSIPYATPPHVQVCISMWDISNKTNIRADVQAENITVQGFEIVFRTWADTQVARVRVAWTSIGELSNDDGWDLY